MFVPRLRRAEEDLEKGAGLLQDDGGFSSVRQANPVAHQLHH